MASGFQKETWVRTQRIANTMQCMCSLHNTAAPYSVCQYCCSTASPVHADGSVVGLEGVPHLTLNLGNNSVDGHNRATSCACLRYWLLTMPLSTSPAVKPIDKDGCISECQDGALPAASLVAEHCRIRLVPMHCKPKLHDQHRHCSRERHSQPWQLLLHPKLTSQLLLVKHHHLAAHCGV